MAVLFQRWDFTAADTQATALALAGMSVGAVAFSAQTVVNRGFYALQNTLLPTVYGSLAVLLSLPLYWIGLKALGVLGIGLAISASAMAQVGVLYAVWNRRSRNTGSGAVYRFYFKSLLISLPVAGVLLASQHFLLAWIGGRSLWGALVLIAIQTLLFLLLMAAATWLFKIEEARALWRKLAGRFSTAT